MKLTSSLCRRGLLGSGLSLLAALVLISLVVNSPKPVDAAEKPLTNADVVAILRAGLSDDVAIAKIEEAPEVDFAVSPDALIKLRKQNVSKSVIEAIVKRAAGRGSSAARSAPSNTVGREPATGSIPVGAVLGPVIEPALEERGWSCLRDGAWVPLSSTTDDVSTMTLKGSGLTVEDVNEEMDIRLVLPGFVGMNIKNITVSESKALGLQTSYGAFVEGVASGGPADKVSIRHGDLITRIDGRRVATTQEFISQLVKDSGRAVDIEIIREGKTKSVAITPENRARSFKVSQRMGIVVTAVKELSAAWSAGLREGDLITEVNGKQVELIRDLERLTGGIKNGDYLRFYVTRFLPQRLTFFAVVRTGK